MSAKQLSPRQERDLIWLCRRLAGILHTGVSITRALEVAAQDAPARMRAVLITAREHMGSGVKLADELRNLGAPSYVWGAVLSGERGAALDRALPRVADQLELEQAMPVPRDRRLHTYALALGRLGMMLAVGVPILQALEAAAESVGAGETNSALMEARKAIAQGGTLSGALEQMAAHLPPMTIEIIRDGEDEGRLGEVLPIAADYVADEAGQETIRGSKKEISNAKKTTRKG